MAKKKEKYANRHPTQSRFTNCPVCHSRAIGSVGRNHYYCADCCCEFNGKQGLKIYVLNRDGVSQQIVI